MGRKIDVSPRDGVNRRFARVAFAETYVPQSSIQPLCQDMVIIIVLVARFPETPNESMLRNRPSHNKWAGGCEKLCMFGMQSLMELYK